MTSRVDYTCKDCGASGVKLWRDYQTFLNNLTLRCRSCAMINQPGKGGPDTDQIGWLIPAVPTVEMDTYWGYTSVPQDRVEWWKALPDNTHATQIKRLLELLSNEKALREDAETAAALCVANHANLLARLREEVSALTGAHNTMLIRIEELTQQRDAAIRTAMEK